MRRKKLEWLLLLVAIAFCLISLYTFTFFYASSNVALSDHILKYGVKEFFSEDDSEAKTSFKFSRWSDSNVDKCQTADIAIICGGFSAIRRVVPLLKSLLFYRSIPLRFHFVVDGKKSFEVLSTFFDSWAQPNVAYAIYDAHFLIDEIAWIPNKHYSGVYGLLKLVLPKILPQHLNKVLVLDNDILFNDDVSKLWGLWSEFNFDAEIFGLAENLSPWYLGKLPIKYKPWPAQNRGFNTGVILMNLEAMRNIEWSKLWINATNVTIATHGPLSLADQDVLNVIIKNDLKILYKLPCWWNVQLGYSSIPILCSKDISKYRLVHFNSLEKLEIKDSTSQFFLDRQALFTAMGSIPDRTEFLTCPNFVGSTVMKSYNSTLPIPDDLCAQMTTPIRHHTHLYYFGDQYEPNKTDITLIVQVSFDRIQMLKYIFEIWNGPISVAIHLSPSDIADLENFWFNSIEFRKKQNVSIHLVYKNSIHYPINMLRNIAIQQANTEYIFCMDADFVPSNILYEKLLEFFSKQASSDKIAFVVPAFELDNFNFGQMPNSKAELAGLYSKEKIKIFRLTEWARGHAPTDFQQWFNASKPYEVKMKPDFEPYVVIERKKSPRYDERFSGFGWNKVSYIMELESARFKFLVLPFAYLVHLPHSPSLALLNFRNTELNRRCLKTLKGQFIKELVRKYTVNKLSIRLCNQNSSF